MKKNKYFSGIAILMAVMVCTMSMPLSVLAQTECPIKKLESVIAMNARGEIESSNDQMTDRGSKKFKPNRYSITSKTSKTSTKSIYWYTSKPASRKADIKKAVLYLFNFVPYVGQLWTAISICNLIYGMNRPGKMTATYYYKYTYQVDDLTKKKRLTSQKMYVTFRLYCKNSKGGYSIYQTRSHTLNIKGGGK